MERFMAAPLNIVQEGTGTRCPLDTTCIHDETCSEPVCVLYGEELLPSQSGENLSVSDVFESIVAHNKRLGDEDRFSTKPIHLHYRSKSVQNMRFVDTPGIIETLSTGKDNRAEIKSILVSEMSKENTKLCVLVEPKEFATNAIIRICDETFGSREWTRNSIFLMTKFDKQAEDSRTGSKANKFFREFLENGCIPYLTITPTLPKEDLDPEELFNERRKLLESSDRFESDRFKVWKEQHDLFKDMNGDEDLDQRVNDKLGFPVAKKKMREIMLEDTIKRLPEVIASLRSELDACRKELTIFKEKDKMTDPQELKLIVSDLLHSIQERLLAYLNGDLKSAMDNQGRLQTLLDEIDEEEDSDWALQELNFHSENEGVWRDKIVMIEDYPLQLMADAKFLGGKQVQRAITFFKYATLDSLPDPYKLKDQVANITGYMNGGLNQEDWERAMVQITTVLMKDVSHPGVNYVVKHIGSIFRRLFDIALEDVKHGEERSSAYQHIPTAVEKYLKSEFDKMLWALMKLSADRIHCAVEPMYSSINPNLPNYHPCGHMKDGDCPTYRMDEHGEYVSVLTQKQEVEANWTDWVKSRLRALTDGADKAKEFLKSEFQKKAMSKKSFLPSERSSMITNDEVEMILHSSFAYLVALTEHILIDFEFQINHYLYQGFKRELSRSFMRAGSEANWEALVRRDASVRVAIAKLEDQMESLTESLCEVQKLNQKF
ncbi:hypothetical protein MPSEU_000023600 [Mayamaea pseudoterrestris]|nr:hypothetical protein MPSEU_000023600 [Mayamaea pseudoterrestris]